ncbi:hypothetical protein [Micromonospora sp. HUAS LYJ1]|uniref:hypothetical protein n=1 Tax=Micromonospora sp. HUAS LYJ1 TaxID=3061626 RepID=UPI0026739B25|nr:hypothetical protein [Micromonospora sp. HUAS LYJ1]WKU06265.1 hypothetical protein Q2K16_04080 [Micromonospora sp. HUAS LYJ1]
MLAASAALLAGPASTASAATVFGDDFTDGDTAGWSRSGGSWSVVTDGHVGLLARASGATRHHRLALLPGDRVQLQAVNGSTVTVLAGISHPVATGTWHTLVVEVSDARRDNEADSSSWGTLRVVSTCR